jgi:hypothetical protein
MKSRSNAADKPNVEAAAISNAPMIKSKDISEL